MPRVTIVTSLHGGLIWGGLENQVAKTRAALEEIGWSVHYLSPMDRELGDIVHFFGTFEGLWEVAGMCRTLGKPYVCSPVFLPPVTGFPLRIRALRKWLLDRTTFRSQRKLYRGADALVTLSSVEDRSLATYFGPLPPTHRVPNGVDPIFSLPSPDLFRERFGDKKCVLCTGRLDFRKNQLALIQATKSLDTDVVLFGSLADEPYVRRCKAEAGPNVHFFGAVAPDDPLLASAYAACDVFVQPSRMEVLSLSALEAACGGAKLVLSDTWGAEEHFGTDASYVPPSDVAKLREAIRYELTRSIDRESRGRSYSERYSWANVAAKLDILYREVLSSR